MDGMMCPHMEVTMPKNVFLVINATAGPLADKLSSTYGEDTSLYILTPTSNRTHYFTLSFRIVISLNSRPIAPPTPVMAIVVVSGA